MDNLISEDSIATRPQINIDSGGYYVSPYGYWGGEDYSQHLRVWGKTEASFVSGSIVSIRFAQSFEITGQVFTVPTINAEEIGTLASYLSLPENWDDEGAPSPDPQAVFKSLVLVNALSSAGQGIYNVGPGQKGEVMIEIRNTDDSRSIEFISYADRIAIVKFFDGTGTQENVDAIEENKFAELLQWLNGQTN